MEQNRFDVIVVGGGPAGITAATALGRAGFSVLVCEAAVYPGAENWSGAVYFAENIEAPEAFGREAIENGPVERPLVERGFYSYNGHSMLGAALRDPKVFRSCYTVLRPVFDRYLAELAREHGVVLLCETTVQSLIRHQGRVIGVHTERGPAYADVVFLAEGDASHLVTQEGYERVGPDAGQGASESGPHFLQGVKEVVSLSPEIIEERFGLPAGGGGAYEILLRNGTRRGRTVRLNMGGFVYTNRDSLSLGYVLPVDNLAENFDGDHNLLMEWFKGLPEIERWIDGGEVTSYGAKIIRGGGWREIPRLIDDGLAIGGAASGIGLDFPYPNFTGPATAMGLLFADAVQKIAADNGGPGGSGAGGLGDSPFSAAALEQTYVKPLQRTHYYRNVERLADWPGYIERTRFFFDQQVDLANSVAFIVSRPGISAPRRWWEAVRIKRRLVLTKNFKRVLADLRANSRALGIGRAAWEGFGIGTPVRWLFNTVSALLPSRRTSIGGDEATGVATAATPGGGEFRVTYRVLAGAEVPGRLPLVARWYWKRFGPALGGAFADVYTNDDEPLDTKLPRALGRLIDQFSVWDAVLYVVSLAAGTLALLAQSSIEWFQYVVLKKDLSAFREQLVARLLDDNRRRIRLDDDAVEIRTPYEHKLATIRYREGQHSHIKVLWPKNLASRGELVDSPLWNVCPAKVYEVERNPRGMPGVVVNFDNCVKCETCWRATPDVHWSRATQQRLIYETYTPTHAELRNYLLTRTEPVARLRRLPSYWDAYWSGASDRPTSSEQAALLTGVEAELRRFTAALDGYSQALGDSPPALEQGERYYLEELLAAAARRFKAARALWQTEALESLRAARDGAAAVWADAAERVEELARHAAAKRYFWSDVVGKQLREHHVEGLLVLLCDLREAAGFEQLAAEHGLPSEASAAWSWIAGWPAVECRPLAFETQREAIGDWCDAHVDSAVVSRLEKGLPISTELRDWLAEQLTTAVVAGRDGETWSGPANRATPVTPRYGQRDVLLEELAGRDPSLAAVAAQHLLACDLLDGVAAADPTLIDDLRAGRQLAAVVSQAAISNQPIASGDAAEGVAAVAAEAGIELHGVAPLVATALADWLLVVRGNRGYLVPVDDPGVKLEDVGCIGLVGAGVRRVIFDGCVVPPEHLFDVPPIDEGSAFTAPAVGAPFADLLRIGVLDHLAIVRGAATYLTQRAREHAATRVQFPDSFQDEAGRDTIAKFGAVKRLMAEMEAQRILVESLSIIDPGPAGDPWIGAAVRKVLAADAFGPHRGSLGYNCGQVFGGTAFSEDDCIAKYYRDSSPFRFLLAHDDALRVEIGRRRLAAVRQGNSLVPLSRGEAAWLGALRDEGLLAGAVPRWEAACAKIDTWAGSVAEAAAVDEPMAELLCFQAGGVVASALAVKVCLLRTGWRLESGLAAQATREATNLLNDQFCAAVPGVIDDAHLLAETLEVGDEAIIHGDFEPAADIADAEPYRAVLESDHGADSGEWLVESFDGERLRYVPEILWNDPELRAFRDKVEAEQRRRYVEPRFDGLTYNRYIEKLHIVPREALDYLIEEGFLRMLIPASLGGEGVLKAFYYIVCEMMGRYGDAALSLAIMANTSIGTTPMLLGLKQDLPRARAELERVKADPTLLGEIHDGLDKLIAGMARPDLEGLHRDYLVLMELVTARIVKSSVLKYIGGGFLRAFFAAGQAGEQRDLDGFADKLLQARERIDEILAGVEDRLIEYPRRERAHELFLKMISAGYISAFALTEPTAGSDSGGVKTSARRERRRVHRDDDGVLYFWLDDEAESERRNLLDADRVEFAFDRHKMFYRFSEDAEAAEINHDGFDYDSRELPSKWRTYRHGDRDVAFTDIAQIRENEAGELWYEYWELNGVKMWITNGRFAHCFALYATTEPEGVTGFMVDRHAEGMVVGADEEKLGQRGSPTNELSLTEVRVPRECIIGFRGRGQVNALETLNTGRTGLAVTARSGIQEMLEDAVAFFSETRPGAHSQQGAPATALQSYWMGRLTEELIATAAVANELIGLFDHPLTKNVRMESAIGKYYGSEALHDGIEWMERLRGLDGLTHRHRIEKTRRDARVLNIYEGTNEVQRYLLLRDLAQRVLPAWAAAQKDTDAAEVDTAGAHPDLRRQLEDVKQRLMSRLQDADAAFGQLIWSNVNLQPCFFRLAEICGLIKVMDAVLYRLEWLAAHDMDEVYRERLERASRLAFRRCGVRIDILERLFTAAYAYLQDGRYPPDVQLGFLALDDAGAIAEAWGAMPAARRPQPELPPLADDVRIAVLIKPVPSVAPRPRVGHESFEESLHAIDQVDVRSLQMALDLKRRDPARVRVAAYALAGATGTEVLRQALAMGADEALVLEGGEAVPVQDPARVARIVGGWLQDKPADIVFCGAAASDTSQGIVGPALAGALGREFLADVMEVRWSPVPEAVLHVGASGWQGHHIDVPVPCVIATAAPAEHIEAEYRVGGFLAASAAAIDRLDARDSDAGALRVVHVPRAIAGGGPAVQIARTPEDAAAVLLRTSGLADAVSSSEADPYDGDPAGFGQQPGDPSPVCLFVCAPVTSTDMESSTQTALESAARLAAGVDLPLDVVLPVTGPEALAAGVGKVIADVEPRRIYVLEHAHIDRLGYRGHIEWLEEFWGMYRGQPEWLLGSEWARTLFAYFGGQGPPTVDRSWPWFGVEQVSNGGPEIRLGTSILDGAARAVATVPKTGGLRIVTFAGVAAIDLPGTATSRGATEVFAYQPRLHYDLESDPAAALMSRLGGGELTLRAAEYIVDFGYGAGGREGLEELAEPLLSILADELGLPNAMIGATRKVTQDLEVLPMDRQIGQTGVRVSPKVLVALAVSGSPQHVDWIDDETVILAFNVDPDAPLMRLNEQRPNPVVHPVVGDVWETIPRFMVALRARL